MITIFLLLQNDGLYEVIDNTSAKTSPSRQSLSPTKLPRTVSQPYRSPYNTPTKHSTVPSGLALSYNQSNQHTDSGRKPMRHNDQPHVS